MVRAWDGEADVPQDLVMLDDAPLGDVAFEDEEPGEPSARRRRLKWYVLGGAGTLVVVLLVALGPTAWLLLTQRRAHLDTPDTLAGLTLDHTADGQATAEYLRTAVAASVTLDTSVGAVYDDPGNKQRSVMFFGGTGLLLSPDKELTSVFQLLDDQGGGMKDVRPVPAGKRGGEMRCGTSAGDGGDMTVCGWADHSSIALALFPGRSVDDGATLMGRMRDGIQQTV
ncbi:MAG: hypothetical protein V7603_1133 [Micromonosporaceae bacterium]